MPPRADDIEVAERMARFLHWVAQHCEPCLLVTGSPVIGHICIVSTDHETTVKLFAALVDLTPDLALESISEPPAEPDAPLPSVH